ncbi:hypothetical protein GGI02_002648, partial [Coemansia sp. RSA 2322]
MKVTNSIFAFAYASVSMAGASYVGNAPIMPTLALGTPVPALPPAPVPTVQPVTIMPIPVIVADFVYSPAVPKPAPAAGYVASSAPNVPGTMVVPAIPPAQPEPSVTAWPAPVPSYRGNGAHKREVDQTAIEKLVSGTGAMLFNANGNSYMLVRLPMDLAKKASQSSAELRKRANESDL